MLSGGFLHISKKARKLRFLTAWRNDYRLCLPQFIRSGQVKGYRQDHTEACTNPKARRHGGVIFPGKGLCKIQCCNCFFRFFVYTGDAGASRMADGVLSGFCRKRGTQMNTPSTEKRPRGPSGPLLPSPFSSSSPRYQSCYLRLCNWRCI